MPFTSSVTTAYRSSVHNTRASRLFVSLMCVVTLLLGGCGSSPKRPAFNQADTVGAVPQKAFIGTWRYTVLNPAVPEENDNETVYQFKPDGTFAGKSNSRQITMELASSGTWAVAGELFTINVEDVKETSGDAIAGLALAFVKRSLKNQGGDMNPYSITPDRIVLYSDKNAVAVQLDRVN